MRSFGPPSRALADYHLKRGGMPLHAAVGVNCKKGANTKIKVQVPGIRAKGCVLGHCVGVI